MGENIQNLNSGHRKRLVSKLKKDATVLADHEILEILLYYVFSRRDTNPLAHELLSRGVTLKGVLELERKTISSIMGMGEKSADFFEVLRELVNRIEASKNDNAKGRKLTKKNISAKLEKEFAGLSYERFIMITCDKDGRIINTHEIARGERAVVSANIRKIVSEALFDNAHYVILAHNHPSGMLVKSNEDVTITNKICDILSSIDVPLIEHYIVTEKSFVGIMGRF